MDPETEVLVTVKFLCLGTDRSEQAVLIQIRLLPKEEQSDQGLHYLHYTLAIF